jgi:hypothetical protein
MVKDEPRWTKLKEKERIKNSNLSKLTPEERAREDMIARQIEEERSK